MRKDERDAKRIAAFPNHSVRRRVRECSRWLRGFALQRTTATTCSI